GDHHGRKRANRIKGASQVGVDHGVPILRWHGVQRSAKAADAGVVHQNVEPAKRGLDSRRKRGYRVPVGDVTDLELAPASLRPYLRGGFLNVVSRAAANDDGCTQPGQPAGNPGGDAPAPARHQGCLVGKLLVEHAGSWNLSLFYPVRTLNSRSFSQCGPAQGVEKIELADNVNQRHCIRPVTVIFMSAACPTEGFLFYNPKLRFQLMSDPGPGDGRRERRPHLPKNMAVLVGRGMKWEKGLSPSCLRSPG